MATKKKSENSKSSSRSGGKSSARKKSGAKKSGSAHARQESRATRKPTAKKARKAVADLGQKTKEVLGDMLAGAAVGAVRGAAQAVEPTGEKQSSNGKKKTSRKSKSDT